MKKNGYLYKRENVKKNWKKRFFVFDEKKKTISYKKTEKSHTLRLLPLKYYRLEHEVLMDEKGKYSFGLQHISKPKESLLLYTESKEEYEQWLETLQIFIPIYNGISPQVTIKPIPSPIKKHYYTTYHA